VNPEERKIILQVKELRKHFPIVKGFFKRVVRQVRAVDGVSFELRHGECMGLVGESGCGKTTTGRCVLRAVQPTAGQVLFHDKREVVDVTKATDAQLKRVRRQMQMIFQDPFSSLNPRMTIFDIVGEPLLVNGVSSRSERQERVRSLLRQVGLRPEYMQRYPHAFSGGQRQRIGVARSLALSPKLIIADEPVSALDVSVQAQVLNLLEDLQSEFGFAYLFIAHDLSVVRHIADRVAVMYLGRLVESGPVDQLFAKPKHPYTEALLSAVPVPDPRRKSKRILLPGEVADPGNPPSGCVFHPRCRYADERCRSETPQLRPVSEDHYASCHFGEQLELSGIV